MYDHVVLFSCKNYLIIYFCVIICGCYSDYRFILGEFEYKKRPDIKMEQFYPGEYSATNKKNKDLYAIFSNSTLTIRRRKCRQTCIFLVSRAR